ncbi:MAG: CapA family protein, partial [Flavobacteriia bacterium]|nr:CapA family protein [Flavobacteriia bacterium]
MSLYMKSSTRNALVMCGVVVPIVASVFYFKQSFFNDVSQGRGHYVPPPAQLADDSLISLIAVGDMMLGTNYPSADLLPPNGQNILDPLKDILRDADLTFGNLEGTVLNSGGDVKACSDPNKCYAFRQPEFVVDQLKDAGFDMVSVANNHMGDFGEPGRTNTE